MNVGSDHCLWFTQQEVFTLKEDDGKDKDNDDDDDNNKDGHKGDAISVPFMYTVDINGKIKPEEASSRVK